MSAQWYQVSAMAMRYWFVFLAVLTVYRALRWMLTDSSLRRKAMRALPDAGYIGHLLVLSGESRSFSQGDEIPLPCEGTLGSSRRCDVCVHHKSLFAREAFFWLEPDGLHMSPLHSGSFAVDGEQVGAGDEAILRSGARLFIGEVSLELQLLKGLNLDEPLEPYVTPERRRRAQRATQRQPRRKKETTPEGRKDAQKQIKKEEPAVRPRRRAPQKAADPQAPCAPARRRRAASDTPPIAPKKASPAQKTDAPARTRAAQPKRPAPRQRHLQPPEG